MNHIVVTDESDQIAWSQAISIQDSGVLMAGLTYTTMEIPLDERFYAANILGVSTGTLLWKTELQIGGTWYTLNSASGTIYVRSNLNTQYGTLRWKLTNSGSNPVTWKLVAGLAA